MNVVTQLDEARQRHAEAVTKMEDWDARCQDVPEEASLEEIEFLKNSFNSSRAETQRWAERVERLEAIAEARRQLQPPADEADTSELADGTASKKIKVGGEPLTYRERGEHSFFHDLYEAQVRGNPMSARRLDQHMHEMSIEKRDLTTSLTPGGGAFIPPIYLGERWVELPRPRRPFADAVPKIPLDPEGLVMTFPRIQSGAAVAAMDGENQAVTETDLDTENYTVDVRTIAGQNDVSRQLLERSRPGIDEVIFRDLLRAYDAYLEAQLLAGTGANGQHRGLRNVSGINTVAFASGDGAGLVKAVYDASQKIASNNAGAASLIVMHPRRAAWIAAHQGTTFPLLQQGNLNQAQGTQDNGFVGTIAGLSVIASSAIDTGLGGSTNEDELYVVDLSELMLAEGDLRVDVFRDVLSGTLTVRLQISAYSAFVGGRVPKAVTKISGAGLATPTF